MAEGKTESAELETEVGDEADGPFGPSNLQTSERDAGDEKPEDEDAQEEAAEVEDEKSEAEAEGADEEGEKTEQEATDDEADTPRLPWSSGRQRADQERANLRKENAHIRDALGKLTEEVRAMRRGEKLPMTAQDALAEARKAADALAELELPDAFDDEEKVEAYRKTRGRLAAAARAAGEKAEALLAQADKPEDQAKADAKPKAKPEQGAEAEQAPAGPKPATHADFRAIVAEADKRYGAKLRAGAVADVMKELAARKYGPGKSATAEVLRDLVLRVYAEHAHQGARAKPGETATREGAREKPRELPAGPFGHPPKEHRPVSAYDVAEQVKRKARRQA